MKEIKPLCSNTIVGLDEHEWSPSNFDDFIKELEHIIKACPGGNPIFRGHTNRMWLLESTFVRTCKKILLGLESHIRPSNEVRRSVEYNQALFGLLLLKYDVLVRPSQELKVLEREKDIDALFELMKRYQQYPEEDKSILKGTFFLDWTQSKEVGLFFTNFDANKDYSKDRENDGALFICDKTAARKTLMRRNGKPIKVEEIINLMVKATHENKAFGCPLLFYPPKQIHSLQANRQDAIYWAQMDLRYDLEDIWSQQEMAESRNERIFIKLILPNDTQNDCEDYLNTRGVNHEYLFPNK